MTDAGPPTGQQPGSGWGTPPPPPPGWGPPPAWGGGTPFGAQAAPKPGIVPLRPLSLGEILDGAFTCVQRYPTIMLGMSAAIMGVLMIASFATFFVAFGDVWSGPSPDLRAVSDATWIGLFGTGLGLAVATWVGSSVLTGMITVTVSRGVLGQPISVGEAWAASRRHVPRLLGLSLLLGTVAAVAVGVLTAVVVAGFVLDVTAGVLLLVVALVGGILGGIVLYARTALAPAALVLETQPAAPAVIAAPTPRLGVFTSVGRSWQLVKSRTWRTFGLLFVANLIATLVAGVIQTAFTIISGGAGAAIGDSMASQQLIPLVLVGIGYIASAVLQVAFLSGVNTLLYVDARMRREGLDIELAQLSASGGTAGAAGAAGSPWTTR